MSILSVFSNGAFHLCLGFHRAGMVAVDDFLYCIISIRLSRKYFIFMRKFSVQF